MVFTLPANFDLKRVLKIGVISTLAIMVIAFAVLLVSATVGIFTKKSSVSVLQAPYAGITNSIPSQGRGGKYSEDASYGVEGSAPGLSVRNIAPFPPIQNGGTTGSDAEAYEVRQYSGTIETRDKNEACNALFNLKAKDYVVFEQANSYDQGCNFTFKVTRNHVEEVLAAVKALQPRELVENTHTIKQQVEDYTSQIEILRKKQTTIEDTLEKATEAYNEITALAQRTGDADSLARIINSKIQTLERLTQERLNVSAQLDNLTRAKAEQLDRLEYTYFYLTVVESKFVDAKTLKDLWKAAIKAFVRDVNEVALDVSVNLVTLVLRVLQYLLYAFIILVVAKYAWSLARRIWTGQSPPKV
ncbi:MAG: hypothetical protein AB1352_01195 [Patescibacteria group bacterium]